MVGTRVGGGSSGVEGHRTRWSRGAHGHGGKGRGGGDRQSFREILSRRSRIVGVQTCTTEAGRGGEVLGRKKMRQGGVTLEKTVARTTSVNE